MSEFEQVLHFYNNTIELRYDDKLHEYARMTDGYRIVIPGCTTVLDVLDKPALPQWAANSTVAWILQTFNSAQLNEAYQAIKDKAPWDEVEVKYNLASVSTNAAYMAKLLNDARFNFRKISQTAKDIGTVAHDWLEFFINQVIAKQNTLEAAGLAMPENESAAKCVSAALAWMRKHNFTPVGSEQKIYSLEFDYSGTYDWLAWITGCGEPDCCEFLGPKFVLGDFKSSKAIYEEYIIQTAAYWKAREEEHPEQPIDAALVLRLGKEDGEFETRTILRHEADNAFEAFTGALMVYNWKRQSELDKRQAKKDLKDATAKPKRPIRKIKAKLMPLIPVEVKAA